MKHLSTDEIMEFVSLENISAESLALIEKVNSHIRVCKGCFGKVRAFQLVYDELSCGTEKKNFAVLQEKVLQKERYKNLKR